MKKMTLCRKLKFFFLKLARDGGSAYVITLGAIKGTFISAFPSFGFGTLLVLLLYKFMKFNLIAAVGTSMISNPFTSPFFMISSFKIGSIILATNIEFSVQN